MARVCYVVLAHTEPANLAGVVGALYNEQDSFLLCLDAKATGHCRQTARALCDSAANIRMMQGALMAWGGFSIVESTLAAYAALQHEAATFSHVILCSGTHIALRHPDRIFAEVERLPGWMDVARVDLPPGGLPAVDSLPKGWRRDVLMRIRHRYAEQPGVGMHPVGERASWPAPTLLEGSQWHVLRHDLFRHVVAQADAIRGRFHDVVVADEHAFQWAASSWDGFAQIRHSDSVSMAWDGASPQRLTLAEAAGIARQGNFLFARKAGAALTVADWAGWAETVLGNAAGADLLRALPAIAGD